MKMIADRQIAGELLVDFVKVKLRHRRQVHSRSVHGADIASGKETAEMIELIKRLYDKSGPCARDHCRELRHEAAEEIGHLAREVDKRERLITDNAIQKKRIAQAANEIKALRANDKIRAIELERLKAENERLRDLPIMWLGQWRDHMPPEAVKALQDALERVSDE